MINDTASRLFYIPWSYDKILALHPGLTDEQCEHIAWIALNECTFEQGITDELLEEAIRIGLDELKVEDTTE